MQMMSISEKIMPNNNNYIQEMLIRFQQKSEKIARR